MYIPKISRIRDSNTVTDAFRFENFFFEASRDQNYKTFFAITIKAKNGNNNLMLYSFCFIGDELRFKLNYN